MPHRPHGVRARGGGCWGGQPLPRRRPAPPLWHSPLASLRAAGSPPPPRPPPNPSQPPPPDHYSSRRRPTVAARGGRPQPRSPCHPKRRAALAVASARRGRAHVRRDAYESPPVRRAGVRGLDGRGLSSPLPPSPALPRPHRGQPVACPFFLSGCSARRCQAVNPAAARSKCRAQPKRLTTEAPSAAGVARVCGRGAAGGGCAHPRSPLFDQRHHPPPTTHRPPPTTHLHRRRLFLPPWMPLPWS